jgi:hypothetical protein
MPKTTSVGQKIKYPEIGVCGLPCRLCAMFHADGPSRCAGCKSPGRMAAGCSFQACALKRKGVEFCGDCPDHDPCVRWTRFRERRAVMDTVVCSQTLESDLEWTERKGLAAYDALQKVRHRLLTRMLTGFNEGRSKGFYCIAAAVLDVPGLKKIVIEAETRGRGKDIKERAAILRALLDERADKKGLVLRRRGRKGD